MSYYIGIDIGGMSIKVGVVDDKGNILSKCAEVTPLGDVDKAVDVMKTLCQKAAVEAGVKWEDIVAIGAGAPGTVCNGVVTYAANLGWRDVPLADLLTAATGKPAGVGNDAKCAMVAEWRLGNARGYDNVTMITIGTGIGTALVVGGQLVFGNGGAAGEGSHTRIKHLGKKCKCGREDCWELYASASSLLERTRALIDQEPDGIAAAVAKARGKVDGFVLFEAIKQGDASAARVLREWQEDIVDGLANIANLLRPEVFVIGGGVSQQDALVAPLEEMLNARTLGGANNPHVGIVKAHFFNDAGIIGAAALVME